MATRTRKSVIRIKNTMVEAAADIARHHGRLAVSLEAIVLAEFIAHDILALQKGYVPPPKKQRRTAPHDGLVGPLSWEMNEANHHKKLREKDGG